MGPYTVVETMQADGSVKRNARGWMGPLPGARWEERFGEWVEHRFIRQVRYFRHNPYQTLIVTIRVNEVDDGTEVQYEFFASWDSLLGSVATRLGVLKMMTLKLVRGIESRMEALALPDENQTASKKQRLNAASRARLQQCLHALQQGPYEHGLAQRLTDFLLTAEAIDLKNIRPLALAKNWAVPANEVIELCIAAQRSGLLNMRWELLCPRCRWGKGATDNLHELPRSTHCSSCNIDYERNFTRNVELVFAVAQWLRKLPEGDYCLLGAASTPHIKVQLELPAASQIVESVTLAAGRYRLRTVEAGGEVEIDHDGQTLPEVILRGQAVQIGERNVPGQIVLRNDGELMRTVVIEELAWVRDALIGTRVLTLSAFRELCPKQLLRPGDDVAIGRITIMFTDLKQSTALYSEIGDSAAYALVRDHFAFLAERVRSHQGVLIKTIGDAIMAAFEDPVDALNAALAMQRDVAAFNNKHDTARIIIKMGLHQGESIAVTTGGILDYFGTTVNTAARLQGQSEGGDIVLSEAMYQDKLVADGLKGQQLVRERADLEGLGDAMVYYRISKEMLLHSLPVNGL